jgi:hypothetical protein
MSYPIQQSLWESIDGILFNKALALAKEVAAELGVPPQQLIELMKKEERGKFTIIPDDEEPLYQCRAVVQHGLIQIRCRNPILGSSARLCGCHVNEKYETNNKDLPEVQRIVTPDAIYFTDGENVYDVNARACGLLKGEQKLILFQIED